MRGISPRRADRAVGIESSAHGAPGAVRAQVAIRCATRLIQRTARQSAEQALTLLLLLLLMLPLLLSSLQSAIASIVAQNRFAVARRRLRAVARDQSLAVARNQLVSTRFDMFSIVSARIGSVTGSFSIIFVGRNDGEEVLRPAHFTATSTPALQSETSGESVRTQSEPRSSHEQRAKHCS